jgi:Flp pilus assembly protein CpaB
LQKIANGRYRYVSWSAGFPPNTWSDEAKDATLRVAKEYEWRMVESSAPLQNMKLLLSGDRDVSATLQAAKMAGMVVRSSILQTWRLQLICWLNRIMQ